MALTGLEIFKLLPKKNCGECGVPTCLAFAMKLAAKTEQPENCPDISDEAMEQLGVSQRPPIKTLEYKVGTEKVAIGGETIMFRHEKTFINQPVVSLEISDSMSDDEFKIKADKITNIVFERVGEKLKPESVSLLFKSNDINNFKNKLDILLDKDKIIVLSSCSIELIKEISDNYTQKDRLIINDIDNNLLEKLIEQKTNPELTFVLKSDSQDELYKMVETAEQNGFQNIVLNLENDSIANMLKNNVTLRRLAINTDFKLAGYPVLTVCKDELFSAITGICKYSSLIILKQYDETSLFSLLTLRQNIYTDPQKPLQVEPGIYKIGEPDANAPMFVTTNFSLTYFIVSGEIENSPFDAWLLITDSEGMSVLTAWSANKFSGELIAKSVIQTELEKKIEHKKIILPGYVAVLQGEVEDELKGWEAMVGPQEASGIPAYLKETWPN